MWLEQFSARAPVICFDYDGDWRLFCHAMGYEIPVWLRGKNIYKYLDQVALQMYIIDNRIKDHHALNDAKANCHAFDRKKIEAGVLSPNTRNFQNMCRKTALTWFPHAIASRSGFSYIFLNQNNLKLVNYHCYRHKDVFRQKPHQYLVSSRF